jgi:hypothetical protein
VSHAEEESGLYAVNFNNDIESRARQNSMHVKNDISNHFEKHREYQDNAPAAQARNWDDFSSYENKD